MKHRFEKKDTDMSRPFFCPQCGQEHTYSYFDPNPKGTPVIDTCRKCGYYGPQTLSREPVLEWNEHGHPVDKTKQSFLFIGGPLNGKRFDFKESDTEVRGTYPLGRGQLYAQTRLTLGKDTFRFFVVVDDKREGVQNIAYAVKKLMDEYEIMETPSP